MITDGKIVLRAPEPSDVDEMFRWENDRSVWPCGRVRAPMSRSILENYVAEYNPDIYAVGQARFVVCLYGDSVPVGAVDLYDFDILNRRSAMSVLVDSQHRGQGIARRALELLAGYCRMELGLHQLWAVTDSGNVASRALFSSAGYSIAGRLRSWVRMGGRYTDAYVYQKLL